MSPARSQTSALRGLALAFAAVLAASSLVAIAIVVPSVYAYTSRRIANAERNDEFGALARHINAMLERIDALMSGMRHLSDHIAHEMRTPLTRLRSRLERARRDHAQDENLARTFEDNIAETSRIITVFSALLDIAAAEASQGDRKGLAYTDLADVVAEVVDLYEAVAETRDNKITVQTQSAVVLGEPMLLTRMLANVIDNALKFSPDGAGVRIDLAVEGDSVLLSVRDEGPGVSADFMDSAFERFSRDVATAGTPGHGLGLPLVRAIALRHGMRISLGHNQPTGLRVDIRGPRAVARA